MLYAIPNNAIKTHSEGNNPEGKTLMNLEGIEVTKANTTIKSETTGDTKVDEKKWNLTRLLVAIQKKCYPTMIRKENNVKPAVKLH